MSGPEIDDQIDDQIDDPGLGIGAPAARLPLLVIGGFLLLAACFALSLAGTAAAPAAIMQWLDRLRGYGVAGALVFIALQAAVASVGVLPASLLGLAAGAIYGIGAGFGLAAAGVLLGAAVSFGLTRSALRPLVERRLAGSRRLGRLDAALGRDGWRLVLLLRVSPIMPFSLTSYALGLSAVRPAAYFAGTLAALPALLLYVAMGTLGDAGLAALKRGDAPAHLALLAFGILVTGMLPLRLGRLVSRALRHDHA